METCVLIPQEFSLTVTSLNNTNESVITVWTNSSIEKGTIFYPFQGTVRTDKLDMDKCYTIEDVRNRFGLYDEISYILGKPTRYCNWIRFLRVAEPFDSQVNMVCSKVNGEPTYEVVKSITSHQEIVVSFLPEKPEEIFYNSLRNSFYRQTMDCILEGSPLDLSVSLINRLILPVSPSSSSEDERKSISGDSSESISSFHDNASDQIISCKTSIFLGRTPQRSSKNSRSERSLLPCEVCGKAFDRPSLLKRHMRTHTGEKPHICMVCGKGFSTSSSLNTHRRIHSGEKPHQCQVCGKRFTASSNLYYHRMTHIKEKPHKCNLCAKSFPTPGDLKSHMYVHSGSWPFQCNICSRGFSKQTNLKNHLFLHTGDKPYGCKQCNKKFALACNLRAHMKTHEGASQDECVCCGNVLLGISSNVQGICSKCTSSNFQLTSPTTENEFYCETKC